VRRRAEVGRRESETWKVGMALWSPFCSWEMQDAIMLELMLALIT
jgi:hypothetical protein